MFGMGRKNYLDAAKLFAVLCVVYVHASVTYNPVRRTVSAFFMPVFFIMYGMASSGRPLESGKEIFQFLEKRIKSLLVPYVLWALIYAADIDYSFVKGVLVGNNRSLGMAKTNQVLWFLPCMFVAVVLFQIYINLDSYITGKIGKIGFAIFVMAVCGVVSSIFNIIGVFGWDIALSGCLFMIIGKGGAEPFERFWKDRSGYIRIITAVLLFIATYVAASRNLPYLEQSGYHGVVMALAVYGKYYLFLIGAVTGSYALLLAAMVFEKVKLFAYMGRFSLVIMAVHYILFPYVKPLCNEILNVPYGELAYPAAVAICCLVICIPLCYIIDWAVPELNGKSIRVIKKE